MKIVMFVMAALLCCNAVCALEFTEIMANPTGSDAGKEWVELFGDPLSSSARFVESGGSHKLYFVQGSCLVDCMIIIADDASWFLSEYDVNNQVLVYDSSWSSLRNSGELLSIVIDDVVVAQIEYEDAASGLSLQEGEWKVPTPGFRTISSVPEFNFLSVLCICALLSVGIMRKRKK